MFMKVLQPHQLLILSILIAVLLIVSGYSEGSTNQPPVFLEEGGDVKNFRGVVDREIPENLAPWADIGSPISATDADNDKITYSLDTGQDARKFWIDKDTGQLRSMVYFDYENTNAYLLTVEASDGQDATQIDVVVFINNRPEFNTTRLPVLLMQEHGSGVIRAAYAKLGFKRVPVGENIGRPIVSSGVVENPDNEDITFELSSSSRYYGRYFNIDPDSGQLSIKSEIHFDRHRYRARGRLLALPIRILMRDSYGESDAIVGCILLLDL